MSGEVELDLPEQFDVAIVVFVRANGVDERDATDRARIAIRRHLPQSMPLPHRNATVKGLHVQVADVMDVGMAAGNGYLWTEPTSKAFRRLEAPRD